MSPPTPLATALDQLWQRFLPEMRQRVALLEAAAHTCAVSTLSTAQTAEAHAVAHKLAGSLGSFNLTRGTVLARQLEMIYAAKDAPGPEHAPALRSLASELHQLIESRPPAQKQQAAKD
jgi:HPt (histidine-containing phosphotransfer) domain-containing protein